MNVLVVCVQFPYPPRSGVNMRVYQLLRQLSARHRVRLLSYALPEDRERVAALRTQFPVTVVPRAPQARWAKRAAQFGSLLSPAPFCAREVITPELQRALGELCIVERFDVIQLEGSLLCDLVTPPGVKVILDEHNLEYEVLQRMCEGERSPVRRAFNRVEHRRFRRFEERAWARVDGCVVTSDREAPVVRAAAPQTPTVVVPNAVDIESFVPSPTPVEPCTLVFNGTLEYRPNVDAATHLVEDVWPLIRERCPQARLWIVGRAPEREARRLRAPGVEITGEVPDVRPFLHRAAVVAVPVRMGGGTRLKVVEGLALGKAMVSTSLGCEGITVDDRRHLMLADDAPAFAARVLELFGDDALRADLGRAGRRLVEEQYTWDLAGDRLQALYERLDVHRAPLRLLTPTCP